MKSLIKIIILIGVSFLASVQAETYLNIGNGLGFSSEKEKITTFFSLFNQQDIYSKFGFSYAVYKAQKIRISLGGGLALSEYVFPKVNKFDAKEVSELKPFFQIGITKGAFFVDLYVSKVKYQTTRNYISSVEIPFPQYPTFQHIQREFRTDSVRKTLYGIFLGYRYYLK